MRIQSGIFFILCALFPLSSMAAVPIATVARIQEAAALERQGAQVPLKVGLRLESGDVITTGEQSRVLLHLSDKSKIKIGAHARVKFDNLLPPPTRSNKPLKGKIGVFKGLLRFVGGNKKVKKDIQLRVGNTITMGIRGTDVFVKAEKEKDWVCLLEGHVSVAAQGVTAALTQAKQFFVVPKGKVPAPIGFVQEEMLQKWVKGTDFRDK